MSCQNSLSFPSVKRVTAALVVALSMALLTSCGSGSSDGPSTTPPTAIKILTSTTFSPTFDPAITDYVCTAPSGSVRVTVNAPSNAQVSVDGHPAGTLEFATEVNITPGQSFPLVVNSGGTSKTYYVRCLPPDFPTWVTERSGTPQAEYYAFTPDRAIFSLDTRRYVIIADSYGVPVWWYHTSDDPLTTAVLANGEIAWTLPTGVEERKVDGTLTRTFTADSANGGVLDQHELLQLPNGNFIVIGNVLRSPVDVTAIGGGPAATVIDNQIEEIAPSGAVVWRWSSLDHIPVTEISPRWQQQFVTSASKADPYHMNSVHPDGDGFIVSFRHPDAVYRIDKTTGNVVWKLGGTPRAESLAFRGDTYGNFGGQHDARVLPDGTLTLHDNGAGLGRPPRAVRYRLDTTAKTATLVEHVVDPDIPSSICCGSARKLSGGDWVMSWGQA
ncbi:MAG: hypothetical protein JWN14_1124, partial [Chthonomonadales bacterium]|nr:hypothetical protein [Chthonomonadales bacterium]